MKKGLFSVLPALTMSFLVPNIAQSADIDCTDSSAALEFWRPIKNQPDTAPISADELALELLSCLGSPNPELRDEIGYELYTYWLRAGFLKDSTRQRLLIDLSTAMLHSSANGSLARSFSALVLAELVRSDIVATFMSDEQRRSLLQNAVSALTNEQDFRGLDSELGWIHPVAHLSDVLWRFALHPATSRVDAVVIMAGVKSKIAPTATAYHFNESDRLARVITVLLVEGLLNADEFAPWIDAIVAPNSMERWTDAFRSVAGMIELHNTKQFLRALSDQINTSDVDKQIKAKLDEVVKIFTQLV